MRRSNFKKIKRQVVSFLILRQHWKCTFLRGNVLNLSGLHDTCQPLSWQPNQIDSCCWSLPAFPYKKHEVLCFSGLFPGLWADFSISSSYRLISTPAPHSCMLLILFKSPVGAYVLQEVLLSGPKSPTLLYGFIFLLSLSFLKLLIFFFSSLLFPHKSWGFSL